MTNLVDEAPRTEVSPEPLSHTNRSPLLKREMPGLDALRGIAILSVFLYHSLKWASPGIPVKAPSVAWLGAAVSFGWLGVNLFFVLSGFLITGILLDTRTRNDYWRSFYVRRGLRILPLHLVALLLFKAAKGGTWAYLGLCVAYLANFAEMLHMRGPLFGALWSLAVEEQFYLAWPFVVKRLRLKSLASLCIAGCLASPVLRALSASGAVPLGDPSTATWLLCDNLFYGALLAIFLRTRAATASGIRRLTMIAGVAALGLMGVGFKLHAMGRQTPRGAAFQTIPFLLLFCCMLLIALQYGDRPAILRLSAPLRFMGYLSYGIYLLHLFALSLFDTVVERLHLAPARLTAGYLLLRLAIVTPGLTIACWISRRYFEEYFLRFKERLAPYSKTSGTGS